MTEGSAVVPCPLCGGAIGVVLMAQSGAISGAILGASVAQSLAQTDANAGGLRQIADMSLGSKTSPKNDYNKGYEQDFLNFWKVYPLKRDKRKAAQAWRKAVIRVGAISGANRDAAVAQILAGAIRYRDDPNRVPAYTKYAEGWLNGDNFEPDTDPLPERRRTPAEEWAERTEAERQRKLAEARELIEEGRHG